MRLPLVVLAILVSAEAAFGHDTWVETNTNIIRSADAVYIDLKLGNHGNDHRDFKLAGKIDLESCTLKVIAPGGKSYALKERLIDTGYAPKEGYWRAKFPATKPGLYIVSHTLDKIVNYGRPIRSVKSAKTFFVVSRSLDRVPLKNPGFDRILGHQLELIPTANTVTPMGPGQPISVRVLFKKKPLAGAKVSFIPRGQTLKKGFDENFERKTDRDGKAAFTPKTGNHYLVVVRHTAENESGKGYEMTAYSATLTVFVPEICPCCGE